jgi:hypothetical protein
MDRVRRKQALSRLKEVEHILRRWDPIGVISDPEGTEGPLDEYDSYAAGVLKRLESGADLTKLTEHLSTIATGSIGLDDNPELHRRFAQELLQWWSTQRD